jgi:hypothetical protein
MKAPFISQLKQEMQERPVGVLMEICLRLARYKRENKELITYLLFDIHDEKAFIDSVKAEIDEQFAVINKSNIYYARKSVRKILKTTNKYIRFSGLKQTEVELLMYFCRKLIQSRLRMKESVALMKLFATQIQKIRKAISMLHEDLQFDYGEELKPLEWFMPEPNKQI